MVRPRRNPKREERIVKNQVFCVPAHQRKLKFETEAKAKRHLSFLNPDDFKQGRIPIRAYYCRACMGWHVTSKEQKTKPRPERTDNGNADSNPRVPGRDEGDIQGATV